MKITHHLTKFIAQFVACLIEGICLTALHGWTVGIDGKLLLLAYLNDIRECPTD